MYFIARQHAMHTERDIVLLSVSVECESKAEGTGEIHIAERSKSFSGCRYLHLEHSRKTLSFHSQQS